MGGPVIRALYGKIDAWGQIKAFTQRARVLLIVGKCRKHHSLTVLASAALSIRRKSAGADLRFLSAGPRRDFNVEPSSSASQMGQLTPHSPRGTKKAGPD
jgi:hypothetical protein